MATLHDHMTEWEAERLFAAAEDLGRVANALERILAILETPLPPSPKPQ